MDKDQIFIELYKEERAHGKHHESQRSLMANIVIIVAAAIGGLITFDGKLENRYKGDAPLDIKGTLPFVLCCVTISIYPPRRGFEQRGWVSSSPQALTYALCSTT